MNCKNCALQLQDKDLYCNNSGAKVIKERLTLKHVWQEFTTVFLNLDNTFLKTFLFLIVKPQEVIGSYINGTRKKYLNVISFFTIGLTFAGIQLFIIRKFYPESLELTEMFGIPISGMENMNWMFDFYSLISLINLPLYALMAKVAFFNHKKFNYTEHLVIMTYLFAEYSIISSVMVITCIVFGANFYAVGNVLNLLMVIYTCYVYKKLFPLRMVEIFTALLLFMVISFVFFIALSIIGLLAASTNLIGS